MKRPEKIEIKHNDDCQCKICHLQAGYNQACDDWEKFLPDKNEIIDIIHCYGVDMGNYLHISDEELSELIKAISERIRGE